MLYKKLKEYSKNGAYPMHMPGHKRKSDFTPKGLPFSLDVTEIDGFDDLHDPHGILLETSNLAASLYGSREAFLLVNGSTVGILAAIGAHTQRGDKILADSNCHRSIPNAAHLFGLELLYIAPDIDKASGVPCSITPESVQTALRRAPDIKLVVITSPSYEGVVSDVSAIAETVHEAGALLFIDCAHGAHLGFSDYFPPSPISLGADIVVLSLHKTLPALTQCSLLHICSRRADIAAVRQMLGILQTSSPSYVLMASIDHCLRLLKHDADKLFREYENNLSHFHKTVKQGLSSVESSANSLSVLSPRPGFYALDPGKIVIITKNSPLGGGELMSILREKYNLELERSCTDYAIAMTSICDTCDALTRLADAIIEINGDL